MSFYNRLRVANFYLFEVLIFVRLLAENLPMINKSILTQDKICMQHYENTSAYFCQHLHQESVSNSSELLDIRNHILAESARFSSYVNMIQSAAFVTWSLFLGSFLDNYYNGTAILLILNIIVDLIVLSSNLLQTYLFDLSPYLLLVSSIPVWFSGGILGFSITAYSHVSKNTTEKGRVVKFVVLELIVIVGISVAIFFAGQILFLNSSPGLDEPIRTYDYGFYVALGLDLLMIPVLIAWYRCDAPNRKQLKAKNTKSLVSSFFDWHNIKATGATLFRRRSHSVRMQIYLLCAGLFLIDIVTTGLSTVALEFNQKVYHWDATAHQTNQAILQLTQTLLLAFLLPILTKWLKLRDRTLILVAMGGIFVADAIRGVFLSEIAFYVAIPIGALSAFGQVSIKAKVSKLVPADEIGKMLSLSTTIEAIVPFMASVIYSALFSATLATHPGLVYIFSCILMIISTGLMVVEWRRCPLNSLADLNILEEETKPKNVAI